MPNLASSANPGNRRFVFSARQIAALVLALVVPVLIVLFALAGLESFRPLPTNARRGTPAR